MDAIWLDDSWLMPTLECLFNVQSLLGAGLKVRDVALRLAERHGPFRRDHALILFHIDLVADNHLSQAVSMSPSSWVP